MIPKERAYLESFPALVIEEKLNEKKVTQKADPENEPRITTPIILNEKKKCLKLKSNNFQTRCTIKPISATV